MQLSKSRRPALLGWVFLVTLIGVAMVLRHWLLKQDSHSNIPTGSADSTNVPPWGNLERIRITIARPKALISTAQQNYPPQKEWFFGQTEPETLTALLGHAGLPPEILDRSKWRIESRGIHVPVTTALVLGLSPAARQALYPRLGQFPENEAQTTFYRFLPDTVDECFAQSDLSQQTINWVTSRFYRRGEMICFADLGEVLTLIDSPAERLQLVKTLTRETTMLVKLKVNEHTDVDALLKYWGRRGRAKDLEPLLDSLKRVPGGASIDIVHLLPPFARKCLYTYPLPLPNAEDQRIDCFWSSFNFFSDPPEFHYGNTAEVKAALDKNYYVAQDDPQLGDVLMVVNELGMAVHAAVYLANDIVFTKNGSSFIRPWLLMDMREVIAIYTGQTRGHVIIYRLKDTD